MRTSSLLSNRANWEAHRRVAVDWRPPPVPTTVVVPHPDDEALLFGGLIQHQRQRRLDVHVIAVTDGEASYDNVDARQLAATRRREQDTALERLGVGASAITRLTLPDGGLAAHENTIVRAIEDVGHGFIAAPWVHDHHCDHEACGRAALDVARRSGATVAAGLFWAWHRTDPQQLEHRLASLHLDEIQRDAKLAAINAHSSQLVADTPMLTADALTPATWHHEYFVISTYPHAPVEATR